MDGDPTFEQSERARTFSSVAVTTMVVTTTLLIPVGLLSPGGMSRAAANIAFVDAIGISLLLLNRRGWTRTAGWILVLGLIALVTYRALDQGGIESPGTAVYILFPILAGVLLGETAGVITGVLCATVGLALVVMQTQQILPPKTVAYTPVSHWLLDTAFLAVGLGLMRLMTRSHASALQRAEIELAERRETDRRHEQLLFELGERVKELRLLHGVARVLQNRTFHRAVLEEIVSMMPGAWMHPECCVARIRYDDIEVATPGWRETPWRQSSTFTAANHAGVIEVCYTKEQSLSSEGPFLAEERALLDSLADMLRSHIERDYAERQKRELEIQLRRAQKMEALGTLAGGISHDFNNILTAIVGNTSIALQDAPDGPIREALREIDKASSRAADLVRRILLFSRRTEAERRVTDLREPVGEALALLKTSLPPTIRIRATYHDDLPLVFVDPSQIHQVIMNLGTNASHAMRQHGGTLSVDVTRVVIADPVAGPSADLGSGTHARISVSDTGTGISSEILNRLFEPFFTTKGLEGTGLGLSVVHGIVRDHEGAITVESELGRGTVFHIYLPAAEKAHVTGPKIPTIERGAGEHVMYIDDEEALVFLAIRLITRLGYKCTGYSKAEEALQALRGNPVGVDAVVTDFAMPSMTGLDLARRVHEIRPDLPVAILSGYGDVPAAAANDVVRARIAKPVTLENLSVAIHSLLKRSA
jgi:signal transduction histidine kinase